MRVRVTVKCLPYPPEKVERALSLAGRQLALKEESVSVSIDPENPRIAVLEFNMRRAAQYKVVDHIFATVKLWAAEFYSDITIRFFPR